MKQELKQKLDILRQAYQAELGKHIGEVTSLWQQVCAAIDPASHLTSLRLKVHQIAGTSGVFGLQDVSHAAFCLEEALDNQANPDNLTDLEKQTIDGLVRSIGRLG